MSRSVNNPTMSIQGLTRLLEIPPELLMLYQISGLHIVCHFHFLHLTHENGGSELFAAACVLPCLASAV